MTEEMKPCPFCGKDNATTSQGRLGNGSPFWYVECVDCAGTAETKESWNQRPIEDALHKQLAERDAMIVNLVEIGNRIVKIAEPEHRAWEKEQLERWGALVAEWKEKK